MSFLAALPEILGAAEGGAAAAGGAEAAGGASAMGGGKIGQQFAKLFAARSGKGNKKEEQPAQSPDIAQPYKQPMMGGYRY
jgi:DnaJ-class molecular chaperone